MYELYSYGSNGVDDADTEGRGDARLDFALNAPHDPVD